jgi:glutamyl-tRNA reductase
MAFIACGINHKTAPLAVREKIAQYSGTHQKRLLHLMELPKLREAIILSTCNRTEIYCETNEPESIALMLSQMHHIDYNLLKSYFYCYEGNEAIRHLLRVASGIDSMMIGEPQILGQMKQAYLEAEELGCAKQQLRLIFPYIFSASKRIRHQSGIGNNPISVASAAARLVSKLFPDFSTLNALIIGTGEMASLVTKYLQQQGVLSFSIASRTLEHAALLAQKLNAPSLTISDIPEHLAKADVVISATACPLPFIHQPMVEQALITREYKPMVFLDLAVPRDVEANVGELRGVSLFNIDDLHATIEQNMNERQKAALIAEELVDTELDGYIRRHRTLRANDVICDYRTQMQGIAQHELQRATQKLSDGACQYSVLAEFCERLVNKLTHMPTIGLKHAASDNRSELLELAQYLFNASSGPMSHEKIT